MKGKWSWEGNREEASEGPEQRTRLHLEPTGLPPRLRHLLLPNKLKLYYWPTTSATTSTTSRSSSFVRSHLSYASSIADQLTIFFASSTPFATKPSKPTRPPPTMCCPSVPEEDPWMPTPMQPARNEHLPVPSQYVSGISCNHSCQERDMPGH